MSSFERKSIRLFRLLSSLLLVIALFFPVILSGAEQPVSETQQPASPPPQTASPPPQPPPETPVPIPPTQKADSFDSLEKPRNYLSGKITSFASYFDRFFGGNRHFQESNGTVFKLDLTKVAGYGDHSVDLAVRLNFRLPITERRLHLLVETDPEKSIIAEPIPGSAVFNNRVVEPKKSFALAVRYAPAAEGLWHFSIDGGVKLPINPFVRARGSYSTPLGNEWRLKAAESVYWFNTLGVGETSQLDFERIISALYLFRASSTVTWLKDKQNFDMRQDFSVFHTLSDRTALLYQSSAIGISNPACVVSDYVALVQYRYRLHQKWLFFELSPQLHFPRERHYQASPAISIRLEALFDELRTF